MRDFTVSIIFLALCLSVCVYVPYSRPIRTKQQMNSNLDPGSVLGKSRSSSRSEHHRHEKGGA